MSNPQNPQDPTKTHEKNLQFELNQKITECNNLKAENDALKTVNAKLTAALDEQNRAKIMGRLAEVTMLTAADMAKMATDELERLNESYWLLKKPVKGIRATGEEDIQPNARLTVPNKFRFRPKEDE